MLEIYAVRAARLAGLLSFGIASSVLAGCGGGDQFDVAPVSGTVTMNGQPVTEGVITFAPLGGDDADGDIVGKPASGDVLEDGTFTLSTYGEQDGAVVGKHRVRYSTPLESPPTSPGGHNAPPKQSPYAGAIPITSEVEVKAGSENHFEIEIDRPPG